MDALMFNPEVSSKQIEVIRSVLFDGAFLYIMLLRTIYIYSNVKSGLDLWYQYARDSVCKSSVCKTISG